MQDSISATRPLWGRDQNAGETTEQSYIELNTLNGGGAVSEPCSFDARTETRGPLHTPDRVKRFMVGPLFGIGSSHTHTNLAGRSVLATNA